MAHRPRMTDRQGGRDLRSEEQIMRKASIAAAFLGVVLLITGVVIKWVVAPMTVKLPGNTDITRTYVGTAAVLLNPTALASGDTANALARNVPIVATHRTDVLESTSDSSLISDVHALAVNGQQVSSSTYRYAVDRKNM